MLKCENLPRTNSKFLCVDLKTVKISAIQAHTSTFRYRGVLILLRVSYFVEFVLGRFSHFNIVIAYSNSKFCGA